MQITIYVNSVTHRFWEKTREIATRQGMSLGAFITSATRKELDRMEQAGEIPPRAPEER